MTQNRITHTRDGVVYFIQATECGPVKIGWTGDVEQRLLALRCSSPEKLYVIGHFDGTSDDELRMHREFAGDRLHGEWFRHTPRLAERIEALCDYKCPLEMWRAMESTGRVKYPRLRGNRKTPI